MHGTMRSVKRADREADDAPAGRRRLIAAVLAFVVFDVGVVAVFLASARDDAPPATATTTGSVATTAATDLAEAPSSAAPLPEAPSPPATPSPPPPSPSPSPLAAPVPAKVAAPRPAVPRPSLAVSVASVNGGDPTVRGVVDASFRRGLTRGGVVVGAGGTHSLTLQVQHKDEGATVQVRCSASIAALPGRNIVGSLSARADVDAGDAPVDELYGHAAEACAQSLSADLVGWLRAHR
jgi:type IV secretory pathway VirB10-like protein